MPWEIVTRKIPNAKLCQYVHSGPWGYVTQSEWMLLERARLRSIGYRARVVRMAHSTWLECQREKRNGM
jgi:hypothetical protein